MLGLLRIRHIRQFATFSLLCFVNAYVAACGSMDASDRRQSHTNQEQPPADTDAVDARDPGSSEVAEKAVLPTARFSAPSQIKEATVNGSYNIEVSFVTPPTETTWSLFYSKIKGDHAAGTIILADKPLTNLSYNWTMEDLDDGEYFLYLVLNHADGSASVVAADGSINHQGHSTTDNVSPQITELDAEFSAGTRLVGINEVVDMDYHVVDADGDDITVSIELSSDGGVTYDLVLALDAPKDGFLWNVAESGVPEGLYHLRITASDGISLPDERTSSAPFAVSGNATYTYDADIRPILATNCKPCHDSGGSGYSVFDWASYGNGPNGVPDKFAGYMSNRISTLAVDFETMPKGKNPLSATERSKIKIWYLQGAREN